MNISEIQHAARNFSNARNSLAGLVENLNDEIEKLKRFHMSAIKQAVNHAAQRREELRAAIESAPELFESPRTQVLHGIKVGFRKGAGGIEWDDDEQVSRLIKKHFEDQFDVLVKTTHKPQKKALGQLEVADLKKLGCRVEETGDVVVIKPTDSEVDKLVTALLKGAVDEAKAEAA